MDALELAEKAKYQNIVDMAVGFTAMLPLFQERSADLIKEKLTDLFEDLDRISSDQDFSKMHRDFCRWFVKTIRLAKTEEPSSYGHAANVLDIALKVYVYYCKMPSPAKAESLMPRLNGAIDTPILRYLFKKLEDIYGKSYPPHYLWTIKMINKNEELNREIKELKRFDAKELGLVHHRLSERIKELNCLYDISSFRDATDFSLDAILQTVLDFIPPAIQFPEITCARLIFGGYELTTKNFKDTKWKLSREITGNNKWIGTLEVCYLEEKPELDEGPFLKEAKNLMNAVAESIAKIIEREEAEAEIRKHQDHIEALIRKAAKKVTHIR